MNKDFLFAVSATVMLMMVLVGLNHWYNVSHQQAKQAPTVKASILNDLQSVGIHAE